MEKKKIFVDGVISGELNFHRRRDGDKRKTRTRTRMTTGATRIS